MTAPRPVPRSVTVAAVLAGAWAVVFVLANGLWLAAYLRSGHVGMLWVVVVTGGFAGLVLVGLPAVAAGVVAVRDAADVAASRRVRRVAWASLLVAATGPAEAVALAVLFCRVWGRC